MQLGTFRDPTLPLGGRMLDRTAVRGVLFDGPRLLLLGSRHGDFKFPGGGVEAGESFAAALARETAVLEWLAQASPSPGSM